MRVTDVLCLSVLTIHAWCTKGSTQRDSAKNILKLKQKGQSYLFSLTNEWCLPAPSVMKSEEREIVVDSGASMHMLSRKDLNSTELETVRVSRSPMTVVAAKCKQKKKRQCMSKSGTYS